MSACFSTVSKTNILLLDLKSSMELQPTQKKKPKYRKGLWSPEEDNKLRNHIINHGHGCWSSVPIKAGLQRNGKSCRLRWINYLRPGLKRGLFSKYEEDTIMSLHHMLGNKWSLIAQKLPGRTDNEIKNYWHSYLKKKLSKTKEMESTNQIHHATSSSDTIDSSSLSTCTLANQDPNYVLLNMDKSALPSDHSLSQNYDITTQSSLPKLLFAEWLSVDHVNGGSSVNSEDNSLVFGNGYDQNSTLQEGFMHMPLHFGEEYQDGIIQSSVTEVYNAQIKISNQVDENNLFHYMPGVDLSSNFTLNNDVMYV